MVGGDAECLDGASQGGAAATTPEPTPSPASNRTVRLRVATERWARPVHPADQAQARLFDDLIRCEIAELEELAATAEARWTRRRESGIGDDHVPEAMVRLRARLQEAHDLLGALRDRFMSG